MKRIEILNRQGVITILVDSFIYYRGTDHTEAHLLFAALSSLALLLREEVTVH